MSKIATLLILIVGLNFAFAAYHQKSEGGWIFKNNPEAQESKSMTTTITSAISQQEKPNIWITVLIVEILLLVIAVFLAQAPILTLCVLLVIFIYLFVFNPNKVG